MALAQLALACVREKRVLAIVSADALSAQRLADEIPWLAPGVRVALLPDWETLPYDQFSPHHDLVSERLATLHHVSRAECDVLVVAAGTALYRLAPPSYLAAFTFFLKQGTRLDADALRAQLALAGYSHVTQVVSPGEFSVRGGLIDLFPMGSPLPYRLDLFGDDIETIRTFDVDTQRTLYPVPEIRLLPAREFPLDDAGRTRFRGRYREVFEGDPSKSALYKDVSHGIAPGGIEYYLPLFFDATGTLADYLPRDAVVALHGNVHDAIARFWQDTEARYRLLRGDKARPLLPPLELFLPEDAFNGMVKGCARIEVPAGSADMPAHGAPIAPLPSVQVDRRAEDPLAALTASRGCRSPATMRRRPRHRHRTGIVRPDDPVADCRQIRGATGDPRLATARVFARATPEQKLDIIQARRGAGDVVAMTGDGVNDGPALRRADIGVAMGRRGTEVARQAADLVLADDDLATVVAAVDEGRRVYDNIRRFLLYGLSGGSAEILVMLVGPFLGMPLPLLPAQILWVNLLTHGLPGVALGSEPVDPGVMRRPPRPPAESVLGAGLWQRIVRVGSWSPRSPRRGGVGPRHRRPGRRLAFFALGATQLAVALGSRARPGTGQPDAAGRRRRCAGATARRPVPAGAAAPARYQPLPRPTWSWSALPSTLGYAAIRLDRTLHRGHGARVMGAVMGGRS